MKQHPVETAPAAPLSVRVGSITSTDADRSSGPASRALGLVALAVAALTALLSILGPAFLLLGLVPLAIGVVLAVRGRVGLGLAVCALALALPIVGHVLLVELAVKPYRVPSESMRPTLDYEDGVLVDRTGLDGVDVGDMVVFHPPAGADLGSQCGVPHSPRQACPRPTPEESSQSFLKRVVAGPGDTLSIRRGHPVVNGVSQSDEPYASACPRGPACNLPLPITIPPGHYFMLGDNRGASDDSRFWGPVPEDWIVGVVIARYSPLGDVTTF